MDLLPGYVNTCYLATYVTGPYLKATPGNTDCSEEGTIWADSETLFKCIPGQGKQTSG